jgi:hypothetical protein
MSKHARRRPAQRPSASTPQPGRPERVPAWQLPAVLRFLVAWWGPIVIALAALAMLIWTWGTWPDVLIDFGHERYIPWRLAEGEVLYRDIAFYNGPLSQYFNALCFSVFGAGIRTLVFCNLVLLAMLVALLYYALRQVSRPLAATAACVIFVLLFAFGQYVGIENSNYVCPYSHEVTHGLMLSLVAVVAAWPSQRRHLSRAIVSGLALGLAFLTKAEVFLPGAGATATALLLGLWFERPRWGVGLARLCCFAAALLTPPVLAFLCLASAMPARQALAGTVGSWVVAMRPDLTGLPFFRAGMGMDQPSQNVWTMLTTGSLYFVVLAPAGLLGLALRQPGRYRAIAAILTFFAVAGTLWRWREQVPWYNIARPLPLLTLLTALAVIACFVPRRHEQSAQRRLVRQISLLVLAALLLTKILLNARIFHYGFVLAMPASLLLSIAAFDWLPGFIDRRGGSGAVFAAAAAALVLISTVTYLGLHANWIGIKTERVGTGADSFWADARGTLVNAVVAEIAQRSSPNATLAVLPEGIMINCLVVRRNPVLYTHLMPIEVLLFGEDHICEAFQRHPPDFIVLAHKDTSEFGFPFFGRDYARRLGAWIDANYRPQCQIGDPPLQNQSFGLLLLERRGLFDADKPPAR